ncbi:MAG TPA: N-6 DNA methylase [Pyrinomonadaceae bacterium]|nr:N-6 DNA methylase [Pyrinomonadaceae bacterium]
MHEPSRIDPPNGEAAKTLGAFYTDIQIADFLVWWAIRSARDTVLDPSFGGGVFVRSACNRLLALGGRPAEQVFGVELDPRVHALISEKLGDEFGIGQRNLWQRDFFDIEPLPVYQVNAVVGNPPFIRYHRFTSETRNRALSLAAEQGVRLTQLSSSWAPFVVHSISMVKPGGRLAMVVPMEIAHANYAIPVLRHLQDSFGKVTFLTFRKKLFPSLSEDTLLLLADRRAARFSGFLHRDVEHAGILTGRSTRSSYRIGGTRQLKAGSLVDGSERLIEYFLPKRTRDLYRELKQLNLVKPLGQLVDVGIGYVTGANHFFHLSPDEARRRQIPKRFLKPAVRRGRALSGVRFTADDWQAATSSGQAGYLLSIPRNAGLPESVLSYLEYGRSEQVPDAYKCRVRSPWYSVPHVYEPDAFLTYMSGTTPRLVTNNAGVVAPNSLHILRAHAETTLSTDSIAAMWQTSLTRLSVEVEGHALGGGMLKVEPTEAENCLLAGTDMADSSLRDFAGELDSLFRSGREQLAQDRADDLILRQNLGLSQRDCGLLQSAAEILMNRRCARSNST